MKFSESTIYKDGLNLMRTLSNKVKNISVANRETLGNGVIEHMTLFMTGMKNCWKSGEISPKLTFLESAIDELENGLLFFEMISFCENYTTNQSAAVIKDFGNLFNQVGGLKKQIENKKHNAIEPSAES